jgi:hypothetical protein
MTKITRRQAIAGAIGAMVTAPSIACAFAANQPFRFALITDTHLGRGGEAPSAQMKQAVQEINDSGAELTICCGDLVNAGENPQNTPRYAEWMEIAKDIKSPWRAVPGNHDPLAQFIKHIHREAEAMVDAPGNGKWRFLCFADAKPNPEHQGAVSDEQLKWLQAQLDAATAEKRRVFLVSHIIYHENAKPDVGWMIKDNRDSFRALLERNQKTIAAFFAGHFHSGLRGWSDSFGIHEIVLPSVCWNFDGDRLRGAPGYTFDEDRPAWVLAEATSDKLTLKYKPLGADFSVVKELAL